MKKLVCSIVVFLLFNIAINSVCANIVHEGKCGENAFYNIDENNQLTILGSGAMDDYQSVFSSSHIFRQYMHDVKSINVADGITHIGGLAFSDYTQVTSVTMANSVESISRCAFISCTALETFSLPIHLKTISYSSFRDCASLREIYIYNNVDTIEEDAFAYCSSLSTIYFHSTSEEWNAISIASGNDDLLHARIICLMDENVRYKAYAYTTDKSSITRAYDFDTKTLTVGATVTSRTDAGAVKVIVAVYNADGRLMQTAIKDTFFDRNETKQLEIPLENVEYPFDKIAVFMWDYAEMMKPVALGKVV